ncbi:DUF1249 domain-containing protein [Methyloglobulus sp.]|uniref:DUF1249 domain-containing protein n=1 Tax=Methyloglobulus sp. TaxID=2518622 RepID=UPI00398A42DA
MSFLNPINKSLCLEQVCASNYQKIFRLIPDLCAVKDNAIGLAANNTTLHLQIIEQATYTLTIELSHCFSKKPDELLEPAVRIRIYLDAQLAEVLSDHARPSVTHVFKDFGLCREIMNYKWRLNFFLQKWLDHCLTKGYQFTIQSILAKEIA